MKQTAAYLINTIVPDDGALECAETLRTKNKLPAFLQCVKVGNNKLLLKKLVLLNVVTDLRVYLESGKREYDVRKDSKIRLFY